MPGPFREGRPFAVQATRAPAARCGAPPRCQARSRDKAGMGTVLNWGQARGPAARYRGHSGLIQGGARKWQNQSPMTGRRSMIACSKSGRNNQPFPDPAHSATAWAGYPTSRTVSIPKRLAMPFAGFAKTQWIGSHRGTSPTDDKNLNGSEGRIFCCTPPRRGIGAGQAGLVIGACYLGNQIFSTSGGWDIWHSVRLLRRAHSATERNA